MTDDLAYKTIRLPLAPTPAKFRGTPEERAARVQAHMDRVHPQLAAIRQEEARASLLPPIESQRKNTRKFRLMQLVKADLRAKAIAGVQGLTRFAK